ncbi:MAG: DUF1850 domain-containing protein [Proteobacteria bacterium]|nr:DUF1850 domain-containing protein [Pseudomonadota bacterium]
MSALGALCLGIFPALVGASVPASDFTLAWTHSIEKVRWEEDWQVRGDRIVPIAARVRGGGAGMEPPADAVLRDGWFHYVPHVSPLTHVTLSRRGFAADYELCWDGACRPMAAVLAPGPDGTTDLFACGVGR